MDVRIAGVALDQALELGLDVVAAHDSVGVDYNAPTDVSAYMLVLRFVCEHHGRQAWANVELFAGYGSSSRVYEKSAALLGMTPASYAAGAVRDGEGVDWEGKLARET